MHRSADISPCGRYRYTLRREWPADLFCDSATLGFIMLNPSTADADDDDPTVRKCIGFAKRFGFSAVTIWNLFAYRATDPAELRRAKSAGIDIVGPDNTAARLTKGFSDCGLVLCGWGAKGVEVDPARVAEVLSLLEEPMCLHVTTDGHPGHPLYLPYTSVVGKLYS